MIKWYHRIGLFLVALIRIFAYGFKRFGMRIAKSVGVPTMIIIMVIIVKAPIIMDICQFLVDGKGVNIWSKILKYWTYYLFAYAIVFIVEAEFTIPYVIKRMKGVFRKNETEKIEEKITNSQDTEEDFGMTDYIEHSELGDNPAEDTTPKPPELD